jgi:hypothetical protein
MDGCDPAPGAFGFIMVERFPGKKEDTCAANRFVNEVNQYCRTG